MPPSKPLQEASDPATSPERLEALSKTSSAQVRRAVAQNMAAPKSALIRLFKPFPEEVLTNPASALFDMEGEPLAWIPRRMRVAVSKSATSPTLLALLASDPDREVRTNVAGQPQATPETLRLLSADRMWNSGILAALAGNPSAPADLLSELAALKYANVDNALAQNENTPHATLLELVRTRQTETPRFWISYRNDLTQELVEALARYGDKSTREKVAGMPLKVVTPEILVHMVENDYDPEYKISRAALENPSLTLEARRRLARNESSWTRIKVARSMGTPLDMLEEFLEDRDSGVRYAAIMNERLPVGVLKDYVAKKAFTDQSTYELAAWRIKRAEA